jgi:hypothetical protein
MYFTIIFNPIIRIGEMKWGGETIGLTIVLKGSSGEAVKNLHAALTKMGYVIPVTEISSGVFGDGTEKAIAEIQKKNSLESTGALNDRTIALITSLTATIQVKASGRVRLNDGTPGIGLTIKAYLRETGVADKILGQTTSDDAGHFSIIYSVVGKEPKGQENLFLDILHEDKKLWTYELDASSLSTIDVILPRSVSRIHGHVYHLDSNALIGITMALVQSELLKSQIVATTRTDAKGSYEMYCKIDQPKLGKEEPFLQVQVLDGQEKAVITSANAMPMGGDSEANFVIDSKDLRGPNRFQRTLLGLKPLLGSAKLADLGADGTNHAIDFLSHQTKITCQEVDHLVQAHRLADKTNLPAEIYYSLLKQGFPAELDDLLDKSNSSIDAALNRAVSMNLVDGETVRANKAKVLDTMDQNRVERLLDRKSSPVDASLSELLGLVLADREAQRKVVQAHLSSKTGPKDLWNNLSKQLGNDLVGRTKFLLRLGWLTGNQVPLMRSLLEESGGPTSDLRALAKYDVQGWRTRIEEISKREKKLCVPPSITGKDDQEKIHNYAVILDKIMSESYPTAVFGARLEQDPKPDGKIAEVRSGVVAFLKKNPNFELLQHSTYGLDGKGTSTGTLVLPPDEKTARALQSFQRLFKQTPHYDAVSALYSDGLSSSFDISGVSQQAFVKRYSQILGGENTARDVHLRATQTSATALGIYANMHPKLNPNLFVLPQYGFTARRPKRPPSAEADLRTMFGSLEQCDCPECRTVYSPAAYLVDILSFLERTLEVDYVHFSPDSRVLLELKRRRGDLFDIELTCKNTNTVLPYIDLVLERLEILLATRQGNSPMGLGDSYQTTGTAQELAANPERTRRVVHADGTVTPEEVSSKIVLAYEWLRQNGVYPNTLPFVLPIEESRVYLEHLGVPRAGLLKTFWPMNPSADPNDVRDINWALEFLGITPEEGDILVGKTAGQPGLAASGFWNFYGFDHDAHFTPITDPADSSKVITGDVLGTMRSRVDVFLQQTGLQYAELLHLLDTRTISPLVTRLGRRKIVIVVPSDKPQDSADLSIMQLDGLEESDLIKIHRFVRLWRRVGWEMRELDLLASSLSLRDGTVKENETSLVMLAWAAWTIKRFGLPVEQAAVLWGNIDTTIYIDYDHEGQPPVPSLFDTLFRNKTVINPPDPAFDNIASGGRRTVADAAISAALQLTDADLSLLRQHLGLSNDLGLRDLSALYRHAILARSLNLTMKEFLTFKALLGIDPFASPQATFAFDEALALLKGQGFSAVKLDYLLRHQFTEDTAVAPTMEAITVFLQDLKARLLKDAKGSGPEPDTSVPRPSSAQDIEQGRRNLVKQMFSQALKLTPKATSFLMDFVVKSAFDPSRMVVEDFLADAFLNGSDSFDQKLCGDYRLLEKIAAILNVLKITEEELPYLVAWGPELGLTDLAKIPMANAPSADMKAFIRLIKLVEARDLLPLGIPTMFGIVSPLIGLESTPTANPSGNDPTWPEGSIVKPVLPENPSFPAGTDPLTVAKYQWLYLLEQRTRWGTAVTDLVGDPRALRGGGLLKTNFPEDFRSGEIILRIKECLDSLKRVNLSVEQIGRTIRRDLTNADSQAIKNATKARYEETEWNTIAKPLEDALRENRRLALVSYIVAHPEPQSSQYWKNSDELYEYLLLDVEMCPLMMTSRIKQAISSVQLFMDRVLMNLEYPKMDRTQTPLKLNREQTEEWEKWRRIYRLWEANRKVFLYPENWVLPELRDDKSPFFRELEAQLLQNELNTDNVEDAVHAYLEKLDTVARLEIKCVHHQREPENDIDIIHVLARTYSIPHRYYYRKLEHKEWSGWEKVDLDIEGDHIVMQIWNRRLHIFWLMFTKKTVENSTTKLQIDENITPPPTVYWQIQLAWSEKKKNKWMPKKISKQPLEADLITATTEEGLNRLRSDFYINCIPTASVLNIEIQRQYFQIEPIFLVRTEKLNMGFRFNDSNSDPEVFNSYFKKGEVFTWLPPNAIVKSMVMQPFDQIGLYLDSNNPILASKPHGDFSLAFQATNLGLGNVLKDAFFFQDDTNTFFINYELVATEAEANEGEGDNGPDFSDLLHGHPEYGRQIIPDLGGPIEFPSNELDIVSNIIQPVEEDTLMGPSIIDSENTTFLVDGKTVQGAAQHASRMMGTLTTARGRSVLILNTISKTSATRMTAFPVGLTLTDATMQTGTYFLYTEEMRFYTHYYTKVRPLIEHLNRSGLEDMMKQGLALSNVKDTMDFGSYSPNLELMKTTDYPTDVVDYTFSGAYSLYNWELFFHLPMLVAAKLSADQRFEEARKWLHYVFDPTCSDGAGKDRFWRFKPFNDQAQKKIETLQDLMANEAELSEQYQRWIQDPFSPHVLARMRWLAYMKYVVMAYLDNLLGWADQLFQRDTIESINEATQLYVLAANILGERPQRVPPRAEPKVQTYNELDPKLDTFSNAMVDIELFISPSASASGSTGTGHALGQMAYFSLAMNDKLLSYWDTVSDRLFKIRHCMNIEGVVRQLPLFEPPIDPALLVRATAMGMDLGSVLNDLTAPMPSYRFNIMLQKSMEVCNDVKALGTALLSALEKRDVEALSLLRQSQEKNVLMLAKDLKTKQLNEAQANLDALGKTRMVTQARHAYYSSRPFTNSFEKQHLDSIQTGMILQGVQGGLETLSSILSAIPDIKIGAPTSMGASYGGSNLGLILKAYSSYLGIMVGINNATGAMASTRGGYQRRMDDWKFQADAAKKELDQIDQQLLASQIRLAIAERELGNHEMQIENANVVDEFLRNKYTNQELYDWMVGQVATVYFQSYQLAYGLAKKAERCYQYELGLDAGSTSFIQFGYWDSLRKGLLSGEKLQFDLRRMEASYLEKNQRRYELTKHVSVGMLNPMALLQLKQDGKCVVEVPEVLFDLDYPGHYFRRIKSVSLTIPCVAGPYTTVSCTLRLMSHSTRTSTLPGSAAEDKYISSGNSDTRFQRVTTVSDQAMATSSAQNDSGLFELNFRDDRFLPFEGCGAISTWEIDLGKDKDLRQFDYGTIPDLIMHIKYTALEDGNLADLAIQSSKKIIQAGVADPNHLPLVRMFILRHEFPTAWAKFANAEDKAPFAVTIRKDHFPYFVQEDKWAVNITAIDLYDGLDIGKKVTATVSSAVTTNPTQPGEFAISLQEDAQVLKRTVDTDVIMAVTYSLHLSGGSG